MDLSDTSVYPDSLGLGKLVVSPSLAEDVLRCLRDHVKSKGRCLFEKHVVVSEDWENVVIELVKKNRATKGHNRILEETHLELT